MRAGRLLRLYPRAWRERYGHEFLAMVESESLHPTHAADIIRGALDAWLSADVRRITTATRVAPTAGGPMTIKSLLICERNAPGVTPRDGLMGAGVMLGVSLLATILSAAAVRSGQPHVGEALRNLGFPVSFTVSMPFWLMKGQSWKAQAAILGTTLAILVWLAV